MRDGYRNDNKGLRDEAHLLIAINSYAAAPNIDDVEDRARQRYESRLGGAGPSAPGLSANPWQAG